MTMRQNLTRLGNAVMSLFRKTSKPLDSRSQLAADLERTSKVRKLTPVRFACRAHELTPAETALVERHFDLVERTEGIAEARRQAVEYANSLGRARLRRKRRKSMDLDPWHGPRAA